jgi:cytochrome c553
MDAPRGEEAEPKIVASGAPLRNIASYASCHGGVDRKVGAPWLDGQPTTDTQTQLRVFAGGERRNDIREEMRNIAQRMTTEEISDC